MTVQSRRQAELNFIDSLHLLKQFQPWLLVHTRDVTKFTFQFVDARTSNVFSRYEICRIFSRSVVEFKSHVYRIGAATGQLNIQWIVFVGCVDKSKFFNLGFSEHNFHYGKKVSMIGITFLHFIWYTVHYMSKSLTCDQIHIRVQTDLCYEIRECFSASSHR